MSGGLRPDSSALVRFREYEEMARLLERAKGASEHDKASEAEGYVWCEDALDEAWDEVERIRKTSGDISARIVASHFLLGESWLDVSSEVGLSVDKTKKRAYAALMRLGDGGGDERC